MAKTEFNSAENLEIAFEPFVNPSTGARIETGDTVGVSYTKPDGSTSAGSMARESNTKIWLLTISASSYQQGRWLFRASSSDVSAPNAQYLRCYWGTGSAEDVHSLYAYVTGALNSKITTILAFEL